MPLVVCVGMKCWGERVGTCRSLREHEMLSCLPAVAASSIVCQARQKRNAAAAIRPSRLCTPPQPSPTQRLGSSGGCRRHSGRAAPPNSWGPQMMPLPPLQQQLASRLVPQPPSPPLLLATQPVAAVLPCWAPPPMPPHPGQLPPVLGPPQPPPPLAPGRGAEARCRPRTWRAMDLASRTSI